MFARLDPSDQRRTLSHRAATSGALRFVSCAQRATGRLPHRASAAPAWPAL